MNRELFIFITALVLGAVGFWSGKMYGYHLGYIEGRRSMFELAEKRYRQILETIGFEVTTNERGEKVFRKIGT